ncbi:hypothetical protein ENCL6085_26270 [Enterobacter cloacae subsp. cloacae]
MARHQRVIFALTASQRVLGRPHFHPYQRVSLVNDVCPDVDTVDLFDLQQACITGVIGALEANRVLSESPGRCDFVSAVEYLTCGIMRGRLPVCESLLRARHLVVIVVDFPEDDLPVSFLISAQAGLCMQPKLS